MSDEQRRALARLAGDGDLSAARHLAAILERGWTPRAELERLAAKLPDLYLNDPLVNTALRRIAVDLSAEDALVLLVKAQVEVIERLEARITRMRTIPRGMVVELGPDGLLREPPQGHGSPPIGRVV